MIMIAGRGESMVPRGEARRDSWNGDSCAWGESQNLEKLFGLSAYAIK